MKIKLSDDQEKIVNYNGPGLKVIAGAGAGKTFVLKHRVIARPELRMLYLAYNRPIKEEASESFPNNCMCKTFHGLAFSLVGRNLKRKLVSSLQVDHIKNYVINTNLAKVVLLTIEKFIISGYEKIEFDHMPVEFIKKHDLETQKITLGFAKQIWEEMIDPNSSMKITHDVYFKLLALNPHLVEGYDEILVDESQDANGAKIQLIENLSKKANIVLVGDSAQQINGWNGAIDAFKHPGFNGFHTLTLSQSYRFGEAIAVLSNIILTYKRDKGRLIVKGMDKPTHILKSLPNSLTSEHIAIISRTTSGCIEKGLEASLKGEKVFWVGGIDGYGISDLLDVERLKTGERGYIQNKDIQKFKSYKDFCYKAETEEIQEYLKLIKLAEQFGSQRNIKQVLDASCVGDESDADVTITTAHKSKGMDWPIVFLNNDFYSITTPRDKNDLEAYHAELNLWYVSVTRAKEYLIYGESALSELLHDVGTSCVLKN